jgi:hypothetical protein
LATTNAASVRRPSTPPLFAMFVPQRPVVDVYEVPHTSTTGCQGVALPPATVSHTGNWAEDGDIGPMTASDGAR